MVDAVETAAKVTEHFATGRFACRCEIVDADLRADKRDQLPTAVPNVRWSEKPRRPDQPLRVSGGTTRQTLCNGESLPRSAVTGSGAIRLSVRRCRHHLAVQIENVRFWP